jgi:hypothetical protein
MLQSRCTTNCGVFASAEYVSVNPYSSALTDCFNNCLFEFMLCCPSESGGGTSNSGSDGTDIGTTAEQEEAARLVQLLDDTAAAANADGDDSLTLDEFGRHVQLFTEAICPDVELRESYGDEQLTGMFLGISCVFCLEVYDPSTSTANEETFESCCNSTEPISFAGATRNEILAYYDVVYEITYVQCHQPEVECLAGCDATRTACIDGCILEAVTVDEEVTCYYGYACNPKYFPCVQACESYNSDDVSNGFDGGRNGSEASRNGSEASSSDRIFIQSLLYFLAIGMGWVAVMG